MACDSSNRRASLAGAKTGIMALQSKFTGTVGRAATTALRLVESFDGPASLDSLTGAALLLEAGALLTSRRDSRWRQAYRVATEDADKKQSPEYGGWSLGLPEPNTSTELTERSAERLRRRGLLTLGLLRLGQAASIMAGTGLGRLSRPGESEVERRVFFPHTTRQPVSLWPSRLTPFFNRADAGRTPVKNSAGLMFEVSGKTWHRGVITLQTGQGERTLTHLQSLSLPASHYYFDRPLTDNETAGIITGQRGFEPKHLLGYAGQVTEVDSLCPAWAAVKHSLIGAHLRWGQVSQNSQLSALPLGPKVQLGAQEYPVLVRKVVHEGPQRLAVAAYYDEQVGAWQEIKDAGIRASLAKQVEAGQIRLVEPGG
ncbi:MAG: hypothetical protein KJ077_20215 [Anaerolineae bacterium]|nr:hypothetical protein [Anaerolineae bacterium]